jgi:hypothetical protein
VAQLLTVVPAAGASVRDVPQEVDAQRQQAPPPLSLLLLLLLPHPAPYMTTLPTAAIAKLIHKGLDIRSS